MIGINVKIAINALKSAKVRTLLTMTGIVIGVASVTVIMALGEGIRQQIGQEVDKIGGNLVMVRPGKVQRSPTGDISNINLLGSMASSSLTEKDVASAQATPGVIAASPLMLITGDIIGTDNRKVEDSVTIATNPDLPKTLNQKVKVGEFFTPNINKEVVVLGRNAALKLLGVDTQVGNKIAIRGQKFTVIGILEDKNVRTTIGNFTPNLNDMIYIPIDAGKNFFNGTAQIQQINVRLADKEAVDTIAGNVGTNILANHQNQEDFSVIKQEEALEITNSIITIVTTFTAAIASISLLVGGVGIMNIMLVSVTERTREIGIRKSIGATNGQILSQFLIEAVVISIGGGLIGILLAYLGSEALSFKLGFTPIITPQTLLWAAGVSVGVGIMFGIAPAIKAARKDPIEALRYE